jgi:DNA invertase Pin-like site-specific DNA recombinase
MKSDSGKQNRYTAPAASSVVPARPSGIILFISSDCAASLGAVAELERDLIRERVSAGMAAAKRRGAAIGRPKALSREQAERLERLHRAGRTQREIATLLGIGKGTVARALTELGLRRAA